MTDLTQEQLAAEVAKTKAYLGRYADIYQPEKYSLPGILKLVWMYPDARLMVGAECADILCSLAHTQDRYIRQLWEQNQAYEEAMQSKRDLTRQIDVILNGDGAAKQASLCDLLDQIRQLKAAIGGE